MEEEHFRLFVSDVPDYAIFLLDVDGRVATWNAGAQRIKGYRAEDIVGRHFALFYTPEARRAGEPQQHLAEAAATGHEQYEGWRVRADGSRFYADVVISALYDPDGQLSGYGKVVRDVIERRTATEELGPPLHPRRTDRAGEPGAAAGPALPRTGAAAAPPGPRRDPVH